MSDHAKIMEAIFTTLSDEINIEALTLLASQPLKMREVLAALDAFADEQVES